MALSQHEKNENSSGRPAFLVRQAAASLASAGELLQMAAQQTFNNRSYDLLRLADRAGQAGEHVRRLSKELR